MITHYKYKTMELKETEGMPSKEELVAELKGKDNGDAKYVLETYTPSFVESSENCVALFSDESELPEVFRELWTRASKDFPRFAKSLRIKGMGAVIDANSGISIANLQTLDEYLGRAKAPRGTFDGWQDRLVGPCGGKFVGSGPAVQSVRLHGSFYPRYIMGAVGDFFGSHTELDTAKFTRVAAEVKRDAAGGCSIDVPSYIIQFWFTRNEPLVSVPWGDAVYQYSGDEFSTYMYENMEKMGCRFVGKDNADGGAGLLQFMELQYDRYIKFQLKATEERLSKIRQGDTSCGTMPFMWYVNDILEETKYLAGCIEDSKKRRDGGGSRR